MPIQLRSVGERELRMLEDGHQVNDTILGLGLRLWMKKFTHENPQAAEQISFSLALSALFSPGADMTPYPSGAKG